MELSAAATAYAQIAAAIPEGQPARIEVANYCNENVIRVQIVGAKSPLVGVRIATLLGFTGDPEQRELSDKATEFSWTGEIDGWAFTMISQHFNYALNV